MKAKEMFEKLGYRHVIDTNHSIAYYKEYKDRTICIDFEKRTKRFSKFKCGLLVEYQEKKDLQITLRELKAIKQQIKELNWDNE